MMNGRLFSADEIHRTDQAIEATGEETGTIAVG